MSCTDEYIICIYKKLFDHYKSKIVNQEIKPGHQIDSITRIMQRHRVSRETSKLVLKMLIPKKLIISRAGKGSFVGDRSRFLMGGV